MKERPLTERQTQCVRWLDRPAWLRPMDIGARDASWHCGVLQQLIRKGLVERARRNTLMNMIGGGNGSYIYRLTPAGVRARIAIIESEARRTR
jgi:hypothetical protein